MKQKYTPKITKEKKEPQLPTWLFVLLWGMIAAVFGFDIYRYVFSDSGISANDIFWDVALLAVAAYMTSIFVRKRKNNKNK